MNKVISTIIIMTFAGMVLAMQTKSTHSQDQQSISVGPPKAIDPGPGAEAGRLGMAEYYCHWTRFHAAIMILFTDAAISTNSIVEGMREIKEAGVLESTVLEFTESNWDEYGSKLGTIALANGLDSSINWMIFARSAGVQMMDYVISEKNNYPLFGRNIADQAVAMARHGHDRRWMEFGKRMGDRIGRGTPEEWSQWGLQLSLQARSLADQPVVDWNEFASNAYKQAVLVSESMTPSKSSTTSE